jgi:hypothetical protein
MTLIVLKKNLVQEATFFAERNGVNGITSPSQLGTSRKA